MADAAPGPVVTTVEDGVAVLRFDDGKVNALSHAAIEALEAGLDTAEAEARAVCLVGREGKFSAGFDLSVMSAGPDQARDLLAAGGRLIMRLYMHPQPVVAAVTGHALAAGALLVLACDIRIGADVPAKIGLNETSIGMPLPLFALELAQDRLDPRARVRATLAAEIYDPAGAVEVGYLDRVVAADAVEEAAIAEARRLGAYSAGPYAQTKRTLREPIANRVKAEGARSVQDFIVEATG
ncbi:MAG TPA: crotonase/enoyl-CoA hydratase family protein [Acidimicrobiales bacterium]